VSQFPVHAALEMLIDNILCDHGQHHETKTTEQAGQMAAGNPFVVHDARQVVSFAHLV